MTALAQRVAAQVERHVLDLRFTRLEHAAEAAAVRILAEPEVADGLRALPVLAALRERHQPREWAGSSTGLVCCCGQGAWPCPDATILGPQCPAGAGGGETPDPAGLTPHQRFEAEVMSRPIVDNAGDYRRLGAYGLESPGRCSCDALPGEHTEDQCCALPAAGQTGATR